MNPLTANALHLQGPLLLTYFFFIWQQELKDVVKEELDGIVCKLISLESGGALGDSFVSNHSLSYNTAESDESTEEEPIKQPRTPLQSSSRYVRTLNDISSIVSFENILEKCCYISMIY